MLVRRGVRCVRRAARWTYSSWWDLVMLADTAGIAECEPAETGQVRMNFGTERHAQALSFLQATDATEHDETVRRLTSNDIAVVGEVGGKVVYTAWLRTEIPDNDIPRRLLERFPGGSVYLWGVFVAPEQRGRGIGTEAGRQLLDYCRACGWRWVWACMAPENIGSLRAHVRQGFRMIATRTRRTVCGAHLWAFRPFIPYEALR